MFDRFDRLVVWGGLRDLASHRHIHRAFLNTANKIGVNAVQMEDDPNNQQYLRSSDLILAADVWGNHLPAIEGAHYVLHNFDGSHPVCQETPPSSILRIQVWTEDWMGERWDTCRSFYKEGNVLFQPWGTDLLAEEFMEPVFNQMSREAVFVGAIWGDLNPIQGEMGNKEAIEDLKASLKNNGLSFKHLTHVSDREMVDTVRASRLAPAIAGGWQVRKGYLPCRCFKNASYGALMLTNVPAVNDLFEGWTIGGSSVDEMVGNALALKKKVSEELIRGQQIVASRYTYRQSLEAIDRALTEMMG